MSSSVSSTGYFTYTSIAVIGLSKFMSLISLIYGPSCTVKFFFFGNNLGKANNNKATEMNQQHIKAAVQNIETRITTIPVVLLRAI